MKIKEVIAQTGLTDRAIRYYIDESLLSPSCSKNYLGRKNYDFSDGDVQMLGSIAVLRKYGFSIPEIRAILEDSQKSVAIIEDLRKKKQETIHTEQELLDALLTLEQGRAYTVPELASALMTPELENTQLPEEQEDPCLIYICKALFWIMCVPAILTILFGAISTPLEWSNMFLYKKYYPDSGERFVEYVLSGAVPVFLAASMLFLEIKRERINTAVRQLLVITLFVIYALLGNSCFLNHAVLSCCPPFYSETEDPSDYMILGFYEGRVTNDDVFRLFPAEIPENALGEDGVPSPVTTRYYNYVEQAWDGRFELFAQWVVTPEQLQNEKERLLNVFSESEIEQKQLGQWVCWSFFKMDPTLCVKDPDFYHSTYAGYKYLFFAYHEESGMVRYIASYADDAYETPAFLSLDWE